MSASNLSQNSYFIVVPQRNQIVSDFDKSAEATRVDKSTAVASGHPQEGVIPKV